MKPNTHIPIFFKKDTWTKLWTKRYYNRSTEFISVIIGNIVPKSSKLNLFQLNFHKHETNIYLNGILMMYRYSKQIQKRLIKDWISTWRVLQNCINIFRAIWFRYLLGQIIYDTVSTFDCNRYRVPLILMLRVTLSKLLCLDCIIS